ncbi:MAG: DJ-1/PfpI family protein [Parvibaculum sp.]|uniref:DJ-1/PfpI family protein n=1 Tax=Parvibaculum sp. TaxID=2024848 RepID=UPI00271EAE80|nr:DJ-1/PfpI family protein [Parvibaculum sp.]MDO8838968.1 DJ-1/PfpI family protein [Parvibaculum sp.]
MRISILLYDGFTMLDVVGGYAVLGWLPGAEVEFVAERKTIIADDLRSGGMAAWRDYSEVEATDILYVPGGPGGRPQMTNEATLAFVRRLHETSSWTFGVCNGVEILAAAGILKGKTVTTNYYARESVASFGAHVVPDRYRRDGKIVTTAGVSAGIDGALYLARIIAGEDTAKTIQLGIEYYPHPPFSYASPDEVPDPIREVIRVAEESILFERMNSIPPRFAQPSL